MAEERNVHMAEELKTHAEQKKPQRKDRWLIILILILFLSGLGIRGYAYLRGENSSAYPIGPEKAAKQSPTSLRELPSDAENRKLRPVDQQPGGQGDLFTELAPYLTEGGLSFFLGFCIGYFLRVVAKTVVFIVGGLYVGLIVLSHYGLITVDWGSFQQVLQQLLLNTRSHLEGLQSLITVGIPSVAMGCLGIWRGMKKS